MQAFFVTLVVGVFLLLLGLNVYFRAKLMRRYRELISHRVEFSWKHVFNRSLLEKEVIAAHPSAESAIRSFVGLLRKGIQWIIGLLIFLIIVAAMISKLYGNPS